MLLWRVLLWNRRRMPRCRRRGRWRLLLRSEAGESGVKDPLLPGRQKWACCGFLIVLSLVARVLGDDHGWVVLRLAQRVQEPLRNCVGGRLGQAREFAPVPVCAQAVGVHHQNAFGRPGVVQERRRGGVEANDAAATDEGEMLRAAEEPDLDISHAADG